MRVACRLYTAVLLFKTSGHRPTSLATATKQPCAVLTSLTSNYSICLSSGSFVVTDTLTYLHQNLNTLHTVTIKNARTSLNLSALPDSRLCSCKQSLLLSHPTFAPQYCHTNYVTTPKVDSYSHCPSTVHPPLIRPMRWSMLAFNLPSP